jgi:hypothetical protein
MERIGEGEVSRPMTPMEKDEREEFMKRQNDLEDQLANTVSTLTFESPSDRLSLLRLTTGIATFDARESHPRTSRRTFFPQRTRIYRFIGEQVDD